MDQTLAEMRGQFAQSALACVSAPVANAAPGNDN
jgi:hypothetical protein